jgi:hypothetical protein
VRGAKVGKTDGGTIMLSTSKGNRTIGKRVLILVVALMASICISGPFWALSLSRYLSHMDVYRSLSLGLKRKDALKILEDNKIPCGSIYPKDCAPQQCQFWDFWREYRVSFSSADDSRVLQKSYSYRRRNLSLFRFGRWLVHWTQ